METEHRHSGTGSCAETSRTVHIIEPRERKLLFLCEYLSRHGLCVTGSSDPERGLMFVVRSHPEVLICDLALPQMGGDVLLRRIRAVSPETRVILTSARASHPVLEHVRASGGIDLVMGALSAPGLLNAVERMLSR